MVMREVGDHVHGMYAFWEHGSLVGAEDIAVHAHGIGAYSPGCMQANHDKVNSIVALGRDP
jgi:hypothetical protein